MEMMAAQTELFPVFPTIAASASKRSPLREMLDAFEKHGHLVPQMFVHVALDISKQRAHQLIAGGRIATIEVAGKPYVPMAALDLFLTEERKTGIHVRPQPGIRQMFRRAYAK